MHNETRYSLHTVLSNSMQDELSKGKQRGQRQKERLATTSDTTSDLLLSDAEDDPNAIYSMTLADFENLTSTPFEEVTLRALNTHDVLLSLLQPHQLVPGVKDITKVDICRTSEEQSEKQLSNTTASQDDNLHQANGFDFTNQATTIKSYAQSENCSNTVDNIRGARQSGSLIDIEANDSHITTSTKTDSEMKQQKQENPPSWEALVERKLIDTDDDNGMKGNIPLLKDKGSPSTIGKSFSTSSASTSYPDQVPVAASNQNKIKTQTSQCPEMQLQFDSMAAELEQLDHDVLPNHQNDSQPFATSNQKGEKMAAHSRDKMNNSVMNGALPNNKCNDAWGAMGFDADLAKTALDFFEGDEDKVR